MYHRVVFNPATNHYIVLKNLDLDAVTDWRKLADEETGGIPFKKGTFRSLKQAYIVQKKMNRAIDALAAQGVKFRKPTTNELNEAEFYKNMYMKAELDRITNKESNGIPQ